MSATHPAIDPKVLKPNPWNTNRCSPEMEARIDESLRRFAEQVPGGMFKPVIVRELDDGSLQIIGGQHRTESAIRLKLKTVPYFNVGRIDDKMAKEIGLVDNGRYGEDDTLQLAELLESLGAPEDLAKFMPYSSAELDSIFASTNIDLDDLDLPDDDGAAPAAPAAKAPPQFQIVRFKVPVDDIASITERIERTMKEQHFSEDDSLTNAGNALVHIFKNLP